MTPEEKYEIDQLTCSRCGKLVERYDQIVYSVGDRVCLDCKKGSQQRDNMAYDNWATSPYR